MIAASAIVMPMVMNAQDVNPSVIVNSTVESAQQRTAEMKANVESAKQNVAQMQQAHKDTKADLIAIKQD